MIYNLDILALSRYGTKLLALDIKDGHFNVFSLPKLCRTKDFFIKEKLVDIVYADFSPCENYLLIIGNPSVNENKTTLLLIYEL